MSMLSKLGNFSLFFNFILTFVYILFTWSGGDITIIIPDVIPWGSNRIYNFSISGIVSTVIIIIITLTLISGINILGTGLNDSAVTLVVTLVAKIITYLISSIFTFTLLSILGTLGTIFYWFLVMSFTIGILESTYMQGKGSESS